MKKRIFVYCISLLALLAVQPSLFAQQAKKVFVIPKENVPLYNGTTLGVDVFGLGGKLLGGDAFSSEISVDVNLKNRFFPVLETGVASYNSDQDGVTYKQSLSPYFRIGMNYNTMFKKKSLSHLYVGFRYAISTFNYDVKSSPINDGLWNGEIPFSYTGEKSNSQWLEVVFGIRAQVYKNFMMGWSLRYKSQFSVKENTHTTPTYIPGYGDNKPTNFGVTYSLIYKLPL